VLVENVAAKVKSGLGHRYMPLVLAVVAFIIFLPTMKLGLLIDDYIHRPVLADSSKTPQQLHDRGLVLEGAGTLSTVLFKQFGIIGNKEEIKRWVDYGILPWWVNENLWGGFWRPLASFTHWLDYKLFPNSAGLMHAHNIPWFSGAILLITLLYRRLIGATWLAALAAIMYLIDENNYFPTMFIANRNALLALFFGMLALLAHHRWRAGNSFSAAIGAPIFLLLSLLSGEAGVTTFAYLFAYAVVLEEGVLRKRVLSLVPAVSVIILWRLIYNTLGYGISGVGLYVDPVNNPVGYILAVLERGPILLAGQLGGQSPDLLMAVSEPVKRLAWFFSLVFLLPVFVMLIPLLRKSRLGRFWFVAMVLSVLPFCATFVSGRNLLFAGVAAFGLIATFLGSLLAKQQRTPKSRPCRIAAWALCVVLLFVHLPVAVVVRTIAPRMTSFFMSSLSPVMRSSSQKGIENQDVVVINAPNSLVMVHLPFLYAYEGEPLPQSMRTLVPGLRPLTIRRTGPNTLAVKAVGGDFFSCEQDSPMHFVHLFRNFSEVFRDEEVNFRVGNKVILPRLTIEVTAVDEESMPTEVLFTWPTALEGSSLCWYQFNWYDLSYSPFNVPAVGEQVQIAGPGRVSFSDAMNYVIRQSVK